MAAPGLRRKVGGSCPRPLAFIQVGGHNRRMAFQILAPSRAARLRRRAGLRLIAGLSLLVFAIIGFLVFGR